MSILSGIVWAFQKKDYENKEAFNKAISEYNTAIMKDRAAWDPESIAIEAAEIEVCYEAYLKSKDEIAANESLIDDEEEAFDEANGDGGWFQVELCARLKAANGQHFTALDLLYQLQQQLSQKELGDHIFFEGLDQHSTVAESGPVYYLYCGS